MQSKKKRQQTKNVRKRSPVTRRIRKEPAEKTSDVTRHMLDGGAKHHNRSNKRILKPQARVHARVRVLWRLPRQARRQSQQFRPLLKMEVRSSARARI